MAGSRMLNQRRRQLHSHESRESGAAAAGEPRRRALPVRGGRGPALDQAAVWAAGAVRVGWMTGAGLGNAVGNSGATTSMARSFKKRFAGPWWPLGWQSRRAATPSDTRLPPLGIRSPADLL